MQPIQPAIGKARARRMTEKPCSCFVHAARTASERRWQALRFGRVILHPCNFTPSAASSRFVLSPDVHVLFLTVIPTVIGGCGGRLEHLIVALPLIVVRCSIIVVRCSTVVMLVGVRCSIVIVQRSTTKSYVHVLFHCHNHCHSRLHPHGAYHPCVCEGSILYSHVTPLKRFHTPP